MRQGHEQTSETQEEGEKLRMLGPTGEKREAHGLYHSGWALAISFSTPASAEPGGFSNDTSLLL